MTKKAKIGIIAGAALLVIGGIGSLGDDADNSAQTTAPAVSVEDNVTHPKVTFTESTESTESEIPVERGIPSASDETASTFATTTTTASATTISTAKMISSTNTTSKTASASKTEKPSSKTETTKFTTKATTKTTTKKTTTKSTNKIKINTGLTFRRNEYAQVSITGAPNTSYTLTVYYSSGKSTADGLGEKKSDSNGNVTWTWKIGGKTNPGTYKMYITGNGEEIVKEFKVVES